MARAVASEASDGGDEVTSSPKNKSTNGKKASMAPDDEVSEAQPNDTSDAGSADDSEYEIESIVTSKRSGTVSSYFLLLDGSARQDAGGVSSVISTY